MRRGDHNIIGRKCGKSVSHLGSMQPVGKALDTYSSYHVMKFHNTTRSGVTITFLDYPGHCLVINFQLERTYRIRVDQVYLRTYS